MAERGAVSLGIAASLGPDAAAELAPLAEEAGFHALWVNDTPGADALDLLEAAAGVSERLVLATGVLPVDRRSPAQIVDRVRGGGLPQERLVLGVGSGQAQRGALRLVSDAVIRLRSETSARILIGALGPRMRRLAARHSDGVLLSWLPPAIAAAQSAEAHSLAPGTHVALYVRTAVEPTAHERLRAETARYAGFASYAANFARLAVDPDDTVLDAASGVLGKRLGDYRKGVDEVVLRAIPESDSLEDHKRFIATARPLMAGSVP